MTNITPSRGLLVLDAQSIPASEQLAQELRRRNIAVIIASLNVEDDEFLDRMLAHRILVTSRPDDFALDATSFEYSIVDLSQVDQLPVKELALLISRAVSAHQLWGHPFTRMLTLYVEGKHKLVELPA